MRNREAKLRAWLCVAILFAGVRVLAQPQPGSVLWTYDFDVSVMSSPTLGPDGTIYLGTSAGLSAVTNNGTSASTKWTFSAAVTSGSPAVGKDGTIYCGSSDGNLYAINPNGSTNWAYYAQVSGGSPAIALDNTVYIGGYDYLYATTPSGTLKWKSEVATSSDSPIVDSDGTIYVGSGNWGELYAFHPDGSQKWVRDVPAGAADSPAVDGGGVLFAVANSLFAFNREGTNLWWFGSFDGSPVVGNNGTVYLRGFSDHWLYAISPAGQVIWHTPPDGFTHSIPTSPVIDSAGRLYYCASNSIMAINPQGQLSVIVYAGGSPAEPPLANTSPVIGPDGTIYGALGSKLYAIAGTNQLANSAWPMYRQNARHTGKIEKASVSQPQKRSDNNFQFQLYAQLGQTQTVQTSTDLTAWTSLANVTVTNVPMDVVDLSASNFLSRFYRVYSP